MVGATPTPATKYIKMSKQDQITGEVILQKRVIPQPDTRIYKDGDCGACVMAGLFAIEVQEVYKEFNDGKINAFSWHGMHGILGKAYWNGYLDRFVDDIPYWPVSDSLRTWGQPSYMFNLSWFNYVRMAIDGGYYGIAGVDLDKKGPYSGLDHWIMICGVRVVERPLKHVKGSSLDQEVLISCSSKITPAEEWVEVRNFLTKRGGYNVLLVRPVE